jgi:hypothetical protein
MFEHIDGVTRALDKNNTQWKEDLFFAVKLAQHKFFKYNSEVTPMTGMLLISALILDPFQMVRSFTKCNKGMDINAEDETSYTAQSQEAFLMYVGKEYCPKHRCVPVNKIERLLCSNLVPSETASGSYQSSFDPYDLSSDEEEYLTPNNVAETIPSLRHPALCELTAAWLYFNSLPEAPMNWGQNNPNFNDYHSDRMEISSTFGIPDITEWWRQQEETDS